MNKVLKGTEIYELITDDYEDEVLHDVSDHGEKDLTLIYHVDDAFIKDYPQLAPYKGYWGRNITSHPYDGEVWGEAFVVRYEQRKVTTTEWMVVKDDD